MRGGRSKTLGVAEIIQGCAEYPAFVWCPGASAAGASNEGGSVAGTSPSIITVPFRTFDGAPTMASLIPRLTLLCLAIVVGVGCRHGESVTRVTMKDGTVVFGATVATRPDGIDIRTTSGEVRTIPVAQIQDVRSATDAEVAALAGPSGDGLAKLHSGDQPVDRGAVADSGRDAADRGVDPAHHSSATETRDATGARSSDPVSGGGGTGGDRGGGGAAGGDKGNDAMGTGNSGSSAVGSAAADTSSAGALAPKGTSMTVVLETAVGSDTSNESDPIRGKLSEALVVNGVPVLPAGTGLRGTVVDVKKAGRFQKAARLGVRFDTVAAEGGAIRVQTEPIRWEMKSEKKGNWFIVGAGAAIGTVVGAIAGGGGGAAKGAAIGGAGGAGYVFATEGRNIRVKAGAPLTITLTQPLSRPAR